MKHSIKKLDKKINNLKSNIKDTIAILTGHLNSIKEYLDNVKKNLNKL